MFCEYLRHVVNGIVTLITIAAIVCVGVGITSNYYVRGAVCIVMGITALAVAANLYLNDRLIREMERIASTLRTELVDLDRENHQLSVNVQGITEECDKFRRANVQLLEIQRQSQTLLQSLMANGDRFQDFGKVLEDVTSRNLTLAERMQMLVNHLSEEEFHRMDTNNDGMVSMDELRAYINK